jgi:putative membrane protein
VSPPDSKPPDLGYERTRMAADRTLMAWIRTSVSMISFGFTIFKFFQYLRSEAMAGPVAAQGTRHLGLILVLLGTALLGMAILEYLAYQCKLSRWMKQKFPFSTALIAALLITVLGILAAVNLAFNIGPI